MNINGKELKSGDEVWIMQPKRMVLPSFCRVKIDRISKDNTKIKVFSVDKGILEYKVSDIANFDSLNNIFRAEDIYLLAFDKSDSFSIATADSAIEDDYDDITHFKGYCTNYDVPDINIKDGNYQDKVFTSKEALLEYLLRRMNIDNPSKYLNKLLSASVLLKSDDKSPVPIDDWKLTSMLYSAEDNDIYAINLSEEENFNIVTEYIQKTPLCGSIETIATKGWWFFCIVRCCSETRAVYFTSEKEYMDNWKKVEDYIASKSKEMQS